MGIKGSSCPASLTTPRAKIAYVKAVDRAVAFATSLRHRAEVALVDPGPGRHQFDSGDAKLCQMLDGGGMGEAREEDAVLSALMNVEGVTLAKAFRDADRDRKSVV